MPLQAGARLGPYEIVALIGAGGMGEVYQASDSRLNRLVAVKVLPPHWADDRDMKQRFDREAQVIASLTHPNICTLHDIGREGDTDFLVMEFLEGQTLADRLERGPVPLADALKIAIAIADALDKAHREGVVHRDIKPSNVMLTPSGPKLLDFGLAKLKAPTKPASGSPPPAAAPRSPRADATAQGLIVGTLQYMAPEQVEGDNADARSDIFALGAVFYEMVTGTKAFEGKNRALLIAAIATLDPEPLSKLLPVSPSLDHVVKRCLAKDPDDRWQTAHDLALQLRWIAEGHEPAALAAGRASDKRVMLSLAAALVVVAVAAASAIRYVRGPAEETAAFQFRIPVAGLSDADIALSPDGQSIALVAKPNTQEPSALFVRPVGSTTFRRLGGTDAASLPFWSPDSRTIAFAASGRLKRVEASGGAPKDIGEAAGFAGGAWNDEGTIVFGSAKGLYRVSAEGGKPELITTVEKPEAGHFWPSFLPDGRHFVYLAWSPEPGARTIVAGTLGAKEKTRVMAAESNAVYAGPGYLLFHREATLFAQPFDAKKLAPAGDPLHIADQLGFNPANGRGNFAASQNGVLLYFQSGSSGLAGSSSRGQTVPNSAFGWRDRTGQQHGLAGEQGTYGDIDLSPDGKFIAITRQDSGPGADIWVIDWERAGVPTRLTLDPADDINPVWAPTGDRIAFTTYRKGNADIFVKNANGVGPETPILDSPGNEIVEDWSKDGKYIAYKFGQEGIEDIYALPMTGSDKKPIPLVTGPFRKDEPQFSYDGKWLAYTSDESGTFEVYIVSFPALDQKIRVSAIGGGGQPRWRGDGKELFYKAPDGAAVAVDIRPGPRIQADVPHRLFGSLTGHPSFREPTRHQWNVTPDGQRFLVRYAQNSAGRQGAAGAAATFATAVQPGLNALTPVATQSFVSAGLTVIRHWSAVAAASARK